MATRADKEIKRAQERRLTRACPGCHGSSGVIAQGLGRCRLADAENDGLRIVQTEDARKYPIFAVLFPISPY